MKCPDDYAGVTPPSVVEIHEDDARVTQDMAQEVQRLQALLGQEVLRHRTAEAQLIGQIQEQTRLLNSVVQGLARKYLRPGGNYEFKPEIGAFVQQGLYEVEPKVEFRPATDEDGPQAKRARGETTND